MLTLTNMNILMKFRKVIITVSIIILGVVSFLIVKEISETRRSARNSCKESIERELTSLINIKNFKPRNEFKNEWIKLDDKESQTLLSDLSKARTTDCNQFPKLAEGKNDNGDFVSIEVMRRDRRLLLRIRE